MRYRIKSLKDNWINSGATGNNYGLDNYLSIFKNTDGSIGRILSKMDIAKFYSFLQNNDLTMADVDTCKAYYYDISNFSLIDKNYSEKVSMEEGDIEIKILDKEFSEGKGSSATLTGASNWIKATNSVTWTTAGGDTVSPVSVVSTSLTGSYHDLVFDLTTYVDYFFTSFTGSAVDENHGFLLKLTDAIEASTGVAYDAKFILSNNTQTVFKPEIIVELPNTFKSDENCYEYGTNTFGIDNLGVSITAINSVTLSAYSGTSTTASEISTSSAVAFITVMRGLHTFDFDIPVGLSAYHDGFLTIAYDDSDGVSKTITKTLTQTYLLSESDKMALNEGSAQLKHVSSSQKITVNLDYAQEFLQIFMFPSYINAVNKIDAFIFNSTRKVIKDLEYEIKDEFGKVVQPFTTMGYTPTANFILLHSSILDKVKYTVAIRRGNDIKYTTVVEVI